MTAMTGVATTNTASALMIGEVLMNTGVPTIGEVLMNTEVLTTGKVLMAGAIMTDVIRDNPDTSELFNSRHEMTGSRFLLPVFMFGIKLKSRRKPRLLRTHQQ
jgi:hypothetical protein